MRLRICASALVVIAAAAGCQSLPSRRANEPAALREPLVWPAAPQAPRIRLVRVVARPEDLGIRPSLLGRLGELLIGRPQEQFVRPTSMAARGGSLYVADPGAQALWILNPQAHRFRRIQTAGRRRLVSPVAVAIGRDRRIYLADSFLAEVLVYDPLGRWLSTIASPALQRPAGLAYDEALDRLYVADSGAHQVLIFSGDGKATGFLGRRGIGNGEFNFPTHVAVDRRGTLYVTDALGFRIQRFASDGTFAGQFGRHGDTSGDFAMPKGVAVDSQGHIYVAEALFDAVQIFDREGRFLLAFGERGTAPGQFWLPGGLFIDPRDRIYVADAYNQRVQVFEYVADQPQ